MSENTTGEQYRLTAGDYAATVTETGAGLRELSHRGEPLLLSYGPDEPAPAAFGQLLIPWPNRVDRGRYTFDGTEYQLDVSEPELDCAIHGLVRWTTWRPVRQDPHAVTLAYGLHGSTGYPFRLDLAVTYTLDADSGLTVRVVARNAGTRPAPYAHGAHPYLTVGEPLDDCVLTLPGHRYQPVDERMLPSGPTLGVTGTEYDFTAPRRIGAQSVDVAFTGLDRDADGRAWVRLEGSRRATRFWLDEAQPWLEVYTADRAPAASHRRGIGVEPMTAPPNALATGTDLITLAPGESYTGGWGVVRG
ncbi:aldose 1-epimerase family protein [Streptomyces sp. NPDC059698]|uniref:aldose 1-epimerase family protein n=1 Tax=unclassified Streptomyces TaxID=2593676 RepID=UPI000939F2B8|nr:aldose 1-epimerase family protein [Streptomyces sp. CB02366]OKJ36256.1 aldose epimerase [Streptomyces sp. CB02366]